MTYNTVPDKTTGDLFTEAMWDTYIKDNLNKGVSRPIAHNLLSGSAASITFSSIASDWSHLLCIIQGRSDTAATNTSMNLQFNADASGYDVEFVTGTGSTASATEALNATSVAVGQFTAASSTGSRPGFAVVFIPFYTQTAFFKTILSVSGRVQGSSTGDLFANARAGMWRNTAAITQIVI